MNASLTLEYQNKTSDHLEVAAALVTSALGFGILATNSVILLVLFKSLFASGQNVDKHGILVHTLSVCINDTSAGLVLLVFGLLRVNDDVTAHVCAYMIYMAVALQTMSQGNITCICAQRLICARNLRKLTINSSSQYTRVLLVVNISIGALCFVSFVTQSKMKNIQGENLSCGLTAVIEGNVGAIISAYFVLGILFTVAADSLCFITIRKLRSNTNAVGVLPPSGHSESNSAQLSDATGTSQIQISVKRSQRKAIFTMLLILVFFNLSVLPAFLGSVFTIMNADTSRLTQRLFFLCSYVNSLFNPVIIGTRVQDVKNNLKQAFLTIWNKMQCT